MQRILFAVLLAAAPAFADRHDRHDDDQAARQGDWSGGYDDDQQQYDWPPSDGSEGNWQPANEGTYTEDRGPTFDDFRNDSGLSWNGEWVDTPDYGRVWRPTRVSDEWQPYLYGRWVWTDAGWAWASDEPFGWAVYHYGRWAWSPAAGWLWVPGRTWAPAWVAWRWTDGYAAWCPLGPRSVIVERPALWVVVPSRRFLEPVRHNVVPRPQRQTLPIPAQPGPRAGPAISIVERAVGRQVRPLAIGHAANPSSARAGSASVDFYRPRTAPIAVQPRAVPPAQTQDQPRASPHAGWPARQTDAQPAPQATPHVGWPTGYSREPETRPANAHAVERGAQPPRQSPQPQPSAQPPKAQPSGHAAQAQPPAQAQGPKAAAPQETAPHATAPKSNAEQPRTSER